MLDPNTGFHYRRRVRFEKPNQLRFLTFSCEDRLPLFVNDRIKDAFVARLSLAKERFGFRLYAYVVMPEHVHILLMPADGVTVRALLNSIKGAFGRSVVKRWKELNAPILKRLTQPDGSIRFWETGGGYDRNIYSPEERQEKMNYIHNNPVTRGLVGLPEDWAWSSARWYRGVRDGVIPCDF